MTGRLNNVGSGGGAIELHELNYVARTLSQSNTLELGGPAGNKGKVGMLQFEERLNFVSTARAGSPVLVSAFVAIFSTVV